MIDEKEIFCRYVIDEEIVSNVTLREVYLEVFALRENNGDTLTVFDPITSSIKVFDKDELYHNHEMPRLVDDLEREYNKNPESFTTHWALNHPVYTSQLARVNKGTSLLPTKISDLDKNITKEVILFKDRKEKKGYLNYIDPKTMNISVIYHNHIYGSQEESLEGVLEVFKSAYLFVNQNIQMITDN